MVEDEENSSSPTDQEEPVIDDGITGAAENETALDEEPPVGAPVTGKKPAGK